MKLLHRSFLANPRLLGQIVQTGEVRKSSPQPRRLFDYYAIVLLLEGRGWFRDANHETTDIAAGDVFLLFPGVWHAYGPRPNDGWREAYMVFSGPVFDLWRQLKWLDPDRSLFNTRSPLVWQRRMESLLVRHDLYTAENALSETCRLQQLLADLRDGREGAPPLLPGDRDWTASVKALMEDKKMTNHRGKEFAARLDMAPDAFRKRFTRTHGKPFQRYLNDRRMAIACRLLVETRLKNREICEQLGFCDEFYFCRAFKRAMGHAPREYRRMLQW